MPQNVPIFGPYGFEGQGAGPPVPLRPVQGGYQGAGVRIVNGPSSYSVDPRQIVDWTPTHSQIYGPNVGAAGVMYNGQPLRGPGPAGPAGPGRPPDRGPVGLPTALHPGVRFFTFKRQVLQNMQVGQSLHFQPGRGYYAWPPVTPNPVHGRLPE